LKITIFPADGGTPVILGDDEARNHVGQMFPEQTAVQQIETLPRSPGQALFDRRNELNSVTFLVDRVHDSASDAFVFLMTHCAEVPRRGLVEFEEAGTLRWWAGALIRPIRCVQHSGRTTVFSYTIQAGEILTEKPAL